MTRPTVQASPDAAPEGPPETLEDRLARLEDSAALICEQLKEHLKTCPAAGHDELDQAAGRG